MNERIKELAEHAWDATAVSPEFGHPISFARKLAELIVQECLLCCERTISDPVPKSVDTFEQGGIHCMDEIKHHFGVK